MNHRQVLQTLATIVIAGLLAGCAMMQPSNTVRLTGALSGINEVPPLINEGKGVVEASLNKDTKLLKWKVSYSGLTGPAAAGHFHGPASSGQNAAVVLGFKGSVASPFEGEAVLTDAQVIDVIAGRWYVNIHTARHPPGEIRAQLVPVN